MPREIIVTSNGPIRLSDKATSFMNTPVVMPVIEDIYAISDRRSWVVVCTHFAAEAKAQESLHKAKVSTYLPMERVYEKKQFRRTTKVAGAITRCRVKTIRRPVDRPLLPGYLFAQLPAKARKVTDPKSGKVRERFEVFPANLAHLDGVESVLGQYYRPFPVPDGFINLLQEKQGIGSFDRTNSKPDWAQCGCEVHISDGPFATFLGVVQDHLPNEILKVAVTMFGREMPIELELAQVEKVC